VLGFVMSSAAAEGWGAQVGGKIGDSEVGFMADGGDYGTPEATMARAVRSELKAADLQATAAAAGR